MPFLAPDIGIDLGTENINVYVRGRGIVISEPTLVVLSKESHEITGRDKTSIIFSIYEDRPGELYKILGIFQRHNINLTKIESRPSKKGLGRYLFFVDFEGHNEDKIVQSIIDEIADNTYFLKVLGSYPQTR